MTTAAMVLLGTIVIAHSARGEVVDRIVAVVDQTLLGAPVPAGQIITWSAAYEEARYQAFQTGSAPPQWSPDTSAGSPQLREVVADMIDQLLLEQALEHSPLAPPDDENISERMQAFKGRYTDAGTFQSELARYRLSETALASRLRRENQLMDFVDFTLRPDVRLSTEQIERYYESVLLPRLEGAARGAGPAPSIPPLDEVRDQIQEILTQQEIDRRLEQWLQQLRRSARIGLRLQ